MRYEWDGRTLVTLHNFTASHAPSCSTAQPLAVNWPGELVDLLAPTTAVPTRAAAYVVELQPYDYRWLRAGGIDVSGTFGRLELRNRRAESPEPGITNTSYLQITNHTHDSRVRLRPSRTDSWTRACCLDPNAY